MKSFVFLGSFLLVVGLIGQSGPRGNDGASCRCVTPPGGGVVCPPPNDIATCDPRNNACDCTCTTTSKGRPRNEYVKQIVAIAYQQPVEKVSLSEEPYKTSALTLKPKAPQQYQLIAKRANLNVEFNVGVPTWLDTILQQPQVGLAEPREAKATLRR